MAVRFHPHAIERMEERGTTREEVIAAIIQGEGFEAKFGRVGFRRNFQFDKIWRGKFCKTKQVEVYASREGEDFLVITVITKYF